jgi:aryl-alcohol dehydrogenase-like predicted oxidoreductase
MQKRSLGKSGLEVAPFALGGNVFGWTADEATSFRLLDAFVDAGFNLIDTADVYSTWAPGNRGGESETIIGKWLQKSKKRSQVVIATKVGMEMGPEQKGLGKKHIVAAVEESLRRLQIDTIDLYQSHKDDLETPVEETLDAFSQLIRQGKVRAIGASQLDPVRLRKSLEASRTQGFESYTCLQPLYNLYDRESFEKDFAPICREYGLGVINFYSLAAGFLTGKYRVEGDLSQSVRGAMRIKDRYFNAKGHRIIAALDRVAEAEGVSIATVAVAWVLANPLISAPIASATRLEQLSELIRATELKLSPESMGILSEAT